MRTPPELSQAIEQEIRKIDGKELTQAVGQLTSSYKAGRFSSPILGTASQRAAYLAVRLPATYAANLHVFSEMRRLAPEAAINSMLDLGAGPGTSAYAAAAVLPELGRITMLEADRSLLELGRRLAQESALPAVRNATWRHHDLKKTMPCEAHDLVVISYVLNELGADAARKTVTEAWAQARQFLAIIEPGTMRGFGFLHAARSQLIAAGARILAPCPHALECPMAAARDWCHFVQRLERSSLNRRLKAGDLGYEDEKFSYVIASRNLFAAPAARIVRHPQKHSGHVQLVLCTAHGLEARTVTKSQGEDYKLARKAEWGDAWS